MVSSSAHDPRPKRVLNTGSGPYDAKKLHPAFHKQTWTEVRLDIDVRVNPDLVGSVTDMRGFVADASFDAIWSSHNVEHLHTHEVGQAFAEFSRILKPDGFALITCPDLTAIARMIVEGRAEAVAYNSPAGPIKALDMLYGHSASIASGNSFMAHNTGFTTERLATVALDAGFAEVRVGRGHFHDLWALALMPEARANQLQALFSDTDQHMLLA